ncbi:MAG: hypothetical protein IJ867_00845 [Clostridia bacterium]|nr:hypothetical protein [Clostridia bacterium]
MNFGEKIKRALQKMKSRIILYLLVILIGVFFLISPISRAVTDSNEAVKAGGNWFETFFTKIIEYVPQVGDNLTTVFTSKYWPAFFTGAKYFILFALFFIFIGVYKALPKHEYDEIENGSSDWAQNGEQYRVLSKKQGIILAEKNYLPVDKRGNVNVLVVRRFWCW